MRKRTRLATTAGVTVLGFTAMSGMAQADTGGPTLSLDLPGTLGKTVDGVTKTVDGVVKQTTSGTRSSSKPALRVNLPVHVRLGAPQRSGGGKSPGRSAPEVKAGVKASVKASTDGVKANVSLHLCAHPPQQCGPVPAPPNPIPPGPPTPPPAPPVGNPTPPQAAPPGAAEAAASSLTVAGDSLPFTGSPIGVLALLGATAVLTGAAGIAGSRFRFGRDA
ncbi:hypothetical protein GCM10023191_044090 [Actinoallomurus oryzae]|uniref:LPXTG cell wall anchor domain-containing protein n=1 Tax=Actinoallomurus oryzae TaxID=502180 RepID=A0ABP8Q9G3_9ACTN